MRNLETGGLVESILIQQQKISKNEYLINSTPDKYSWVKMISETYYFA